ncbi:F-box only protein 6 [Camellia lanceoleosa]|uniref:F-box only protein 6 n=1 Tax=Camellia lanceoleosa TaxID=1840588 RepID=A0ACC0H1H0_9ERIC|nr:F-box only protein 6 [Camellia lanceoleosa]
MIYARCLLAPSSFFIFLSFSGKSTKPSVFFACHHGCILYRCCFFNLDDNSIGDGCYSFTIRPEKPGTFKMLEPSKPPHAKKSRKERNLGRLTDATGSTEIMEHQIWKEFPEDLYEVVIARLPIATFFRSVCKKWNSLPTSHTQPWFYTITYENVNTGAMYDPSLKKWHHPTNLALPAKLIVLPVASIGCLVCFLDIGRRSFFVCNPLTQSFKELPVRSVKVWSRVAVGMTLNEDSTSGGYKILWMGLYPTIWLSLNFKSQAVSIIDGTLYFMRTDPDGIVSYNMVTGVWKQFLIPSPLHLSDHALAECGDWIILVGLLTKNAATCVCIWELQKMTLLWKEVDRMPNIWCLEFYGKHVRMTCLGNKGLLMLSLRSRQMNRLVSYDVSSKEWLKVPGCTLLRGRKRQWITCGTAFHPCLTASA